MEAKLATEVRRRANERCEYCRMPQRAQRSRFHVDHIIARQHGGASLSDNLALACLHCNCHKGPNISGIDPVTAQVTRLFDPRRQSWNEHFRLARAVIIGTTAVGRTTVDVMNMNDPEYVTLRESLIAEGAFAEP